MLRRALPFLKSPVVLKISKDRLHCISEFLTSEVGLEPGLAMLSYALESRQRPRHYFVKFLKENGLLKRHQCYYNAVQVTEKADPHTEVVPHLAEDNVVACRGEMPTRFKFS